MSIDNRTPAVLAHLDQIAAFDRELETLAKCPDCRSVCHAQSTITGNMRHVRLTTWHSRGCPNRHGQLGRLNRTQEG